MPWDKKAPPHKERRPEPYFQKEKASPSMTAAHRISTASRIPSVALAESSVHFHFMAAPPFSLFVFSIAGAIATVKEVHPCRKSALL